MNELFPTQSGHSSPPFPVPDGHIGPVSLPGTNREVWWTGRVAIGLRYEQSSRNPPPAGQSALWLQELLLATRSLKSSPRRPATS